jgi:hypothetical protein
MTIVPIRASGTTRVHPESASQVTSSRLWIVLREVGRQQRRGSSKNSCRRENYRTDFIKFEVCNFESSYHAILGRPALAKFLVVLHYVYLLLKMPGRSGVLTL